MRNKENSIESDQCLLHSITQNMKRNMRIQLNGKLISFSQTIFVSFGLCKCHSQSSSAPRKRKIHVIGRDPLSFQLTRLSAFAKPDPFIDTNSVKLSLFINITKATSKTPTMLHRRHKPLMCRKASSIQESFQVGGTSIKRLALAGAWRRRNYFALSSWCSCSRDKYWNCKKYLLWKFSVCFTSHRSPSTVALGSVSADVTARFWVKSTNLRWIQQQT